MPPSDGELIARTLSGDPAAFTRLVDRYRNAACATAFGILRHPDDAQDAAQEAFVQAYLRLGQLRHPDRFGPWLRRVVARVCLERLRRARPALSLDEMEASGRSVAVAGPEASLERFAVRDALGQLSEVQRLTVTLHYLGGYSHEEIARHLEIPLPTVRSRLQHAKRRLREEMTEMLADAMQNPPDPTFTRRTVEEALRRAEEEERAHHKGDALRACDEALAALEALEPTPEGKRLKMDALWKKGGLTTENREETVRFFEAAIAIAEDLGDEKEVARKLLWLANNLAGEEAERAETCLQRAMEIFERTGDPGGQAEAHLWLGNKRVNQGRIAEGKRHFERALPLFESVQSFDYAGVCRAVLRNIAEVGEERYPKLGAWHAWCNGLDERDGAVLHGNQPGSTTRVLGDDTPPQLLLGSIFTAAATVNRILIDDAMPAGSGWCSEVYSYSNAPLWGELKILSDRERVEVPAGTFENCLLVEIAVTKTDRPDDAPEEAKRHNEEYNLGVRRFWYAPGVGLVQMYDRRDGGKEGTLQLRDYEVNGGAHPYLPLALGNAWTYGWADLPEEWVSKEAYRVAYHHGERWHLEAWGYWYRL